MFFGGLLERLITIFYAIRVGTLWYLITMHFSPTRYIHQLLSPQHTHNKTTTTPITPTSIVSSPKLNIDPLFAVTCTGPEAVAVEFLPILVDIPPDLVMPCTVLTAPAEARVVTAADMVSVAPITEAIFEAIAPGVFEI
jgi:hypothetical protein